MPSEKVAVTLVVGSTAVASVGNVSMTVGGSVSSGGVVPPGSQLVLPVSPIVSLGALTNYQW